VDLEIPAKLEFLVTERHRYKVMHGGRGGAKSQSAARALHFLTDEESLRVVCLREVQKSIKDSIHALLCNTAEDLGLRSDLTITDHAIAHKRTRSLFTFHGIGNQTAEGLKSLEGADIALVEEGQTVSEDSWKILGPSIRKRHSEIWVAFNPRLDTDPTYKRFVMQPDDPDIRCVSVNYWDNPWFTPELEKERRRDKRNYTPDVYRNVWCGWPLVVLEGAIYARQMKHLARAGRIGDVPVHSSYPVNTFWDLGTSTGNATAIWIHQRVGVADRFVGYIAEVNCGLETLWEKLEEWHDIHAIGAPWGIHHLPHDGAQTLQTRRLTNRKQILQDIINSRPGKRSRVVTTQRNPDRSVGIDVTRMRLADAYFDEDGCNEGLVALRTYRYEWIEAEKRYGNEPYHGPESNGADALRTWSTGYKPGGPSAADRESMRGSVGRGTESKWVHGGY
jgi:phage terminase large subunit